MVKGPTAGFNIGVSQEFTEDFSRDGQIMTLDRSDLTGNFGGAWKYKIDPIGMKGIESDAALEEKRRNVRSIHKCKYRNRKRGMENH